MAVLSPSWATFDPILAQFVAFLAVLAPFEDGSGGSAGPFLDDLPMVFEGFSNCYVATSRASWSALGALLGGSWCLSGPSWDALGALLGRLGNSWGVLGRSWALLRPSWMGPERVPKWFWNEVAFWGRLGTVLGSFWDLFGTVLGRSWRLLGGSWDALGASWSGPEGLWGHMEGFWSGLKGF